MTEIDEPIMTDMQTRVTRFFSQYPEGLLGIPADRLLLGWEVHSEDVQAMQLGYQIEVSHDNQFSVLLASETGDSSDQFEVLAPGPDLASREARYYRVRIRTPKGWTGFGPVLAVEAGLLFPSDFSATAIGDNSVASDPSPLLRTTFQLPSAPRKARLYITSQGLNEPFINGMPVHDEYLNPGWTAYDFRLNVATYDVTALLQEGRNAMGVSLGDGWHRGKFGFLDQYNNYGHHLAALVQLEVETSDGLVHRVTSNPEWTTSTGEIRFGDIYDGSTIDKTMAQKGWSTYGFDDSSWSPVTARDLDSNLCQPRISPPIREVARFPMTLTIQEDRVLLSASQNISGFVELTVDGKKGDSVIVRHAEVLEPDQKLHTKALRSAKATDHYVLDRDGRHVLTPSFTFHGFQHADVVTEATVVSGDGVAISSDTPIRGSFHTSDQRLNRLHENVVWSQRDNFVGVPTDCPQRDERLGWTGDAQAFAYAANTLFDTESFWVSWLQDLSLDQDENGDVGAVIPDLLKRGAKMGDWEFQGRAGWADAATIVPWAIHESFGSLEVLRRQLPSMRRWVHALHNRRAGNPFLPTEFQFGDWCDPDAPGDQPWKAKVSSDFVANAFFVRSARITARVEALVGDPEQEAFFTDLAEELRKNLWAEFGENAVTTTAGSAIALQFDIMPEEERERVAKNLAATVVRDRGAISTGFLGTPLILHALSQHGYWSEAYMMLLRQEIRSWLYQVDSGATTIWERWDAIGEDGSIHSGEMATENEHQEEQSMISFNHYAYGAVVDWMYRNVGGLAPATPGYRDTAVCPAPIMGMTHAMASIQTRFGRVASGWEISADGLFVLDLTVPFGITAHLNLPITPDSTVIVDGQPAKNGDTVGHGHHKVSITQPRIISFEGR